MLLCILLPFSCVQMQQVNWTTLPNILKDFHDFVEGISQTQGTQTEMLGWKDWLRLRLHVVNTPRQEAIGQQTKSKNGKEQFCSCIWILAIYSHFHLEISHPSSGPNWGYFSEAFIVLLRKIFQQPGEVVQGYSTTKRTGSFNFLVDECALPEWAVSQIHNLLDICWRTSTTA